MSLILSNILKARARKLTGGLKMAIKAKSISRLSILTALTAKKPYFTLTLLLDLKMAE